MAGNDYRTGQEPVRFRHVFPRYRISSGLSVQAAEDQIHDEDLPLQRQRQGRNLPRQLEGQLVAGAHYLQSAAVDMLVVVRSEP